MQQLISWDRLIIWVIANFSPFFIYFLYNFCTISVWRTFFVCFLYVFLCFLYVFCTIFFYRDYRPPNDLCNYCINCSEVSFGTAIELLNVPNINYNQSEYIFFYQQQYKIYRVACEIVPPSLITNFLNRNIFGIEVEQNEQERLSFTFDQKENLKFYLTQYLSHN